jgi:hypothetical protein
VRSTESANFVSNSIDLTNKKAVIHDHGFFYANGFAVYVSCCAIFYNHFELSNELLVKKHWNRKK